jgi:hypothetical protein
MPCTPVLDDGYPRIVDNDMIFRGHCDGKCETDHKCEPEFSLTGRVGFNKNAKITASAHGGGQASIRITADDGDIDNGQVQLICSCGEEQSGKPVTIKFTLDHRTTVSDVLKVIVTAGISALVHKIAG